jgi:hypothetical protein
MLLSHQQGLRAIARFGHHGYVSFAKHRHNTCPNDRMVVGN